MPKVSRQLIRCSTAALTLLLAACASQAPVETATAPEPKPEQPPKLPEVQQVETRPFEADTLFALLVAEIAGSRDRYDIAVSNYVQQALLTRDPGVTARAARIARLLNIHEAALEMALLWVELEPDNSEAHYIAGAELARSGHLTEATHHSAILLQQGEEGFFEAIAAGAAQLDDDALIEQLQTEFDQLEKQYPNSASLKLGLSLLLHSMGNMEAALTAARRAADLEPDNFQAGLQEMRILQAMGHERQAQEGMARLVERFPDNQRLRLQYARMLAQSDLATAQNQFQKLTEQSPGDPDFVFSLALIQLERGQLTAARRQFETLTGAGPHQDAAHYYLGQIAKAEGNWVQALEHYRSVDSGSEYLPAVVQAAQILAELKDTDAAVQWVRDERAQAEPQQQDEFYLLEAEVLSTAGRLDSAVEVLEQGLSESPENIRLLYARAMVHTARDDISAAEQDLKKIIQLSPDNAAALNALGYTLADRTDRLEEAYGYIRAALELEPDDAAILDSMGWVHYRMGNYEDALNYLKEAMETTPDHEIAAHLGEVLWVTGEQQQAVQAWQKGLELNPESDLIEATVQRLNANLGTR